MPQSPELAGGAGFTFEGDVAAFYMTALLAEAYAPGIERRIVTGVSMQQRDFNAPLDDVIVDFADDEGVGARLSLQVKRSLMISAGQKNDDFRDVIRDSWATLNTSTFRIGIDRYGAAVGEITSIARERDFRMLCEWARESISTEHFEQRFTSEGSASATIREVRGIVSTVLTDLRNEPATAAELHSFLSHFVLVRFEFLSEGATTPAEAINRIADCLSSEESDKAPLVWARLVELARESSGASGQYDRSRIVRAISHMAKLAEAKSFQSDLRKLKDLATSYLLLIQDDVGGTRLDRPSFQPALEQSDGARLLQVQGLPGSGKSVLLRRAVQRHLNSGPVLFLKAEQLEGTNWLSFATAHGLSLKPLLELLIEIGATGTPTFFLDAIDRVSTKQQPIVLDILNTIRENPTLLGNWRIVASLRNANVELLRNWLEPYITYFGVQTLQVTPLDDTEAELLAGEKPYLRPLLFGSDKIKEIVRRPFFAKILNQNFQAQDGKSDFSPQSEVDLIENWWSRGGYDADQQGAVERQRLLIELARIRARNLSQPIANKNLTQIGRLSELINDGIVQHGRRGVSVQFSHDIFFEWTFFYVLAEQEDAWLEEINSCGEPPAVARVVELASQWEFTKGTKWKQYLTTAGILGVRSQWLRAWLLGPLGSSGFDGESEQFESVTFENDFQLLQKALVWFQAEKTVPNEGVLAQNLPVDERLRIADALGQPSDYESWIRFLVFLIKRAPTISKRLYPDIVAVFEVWQNSFAYRSNPISRVCIKLCSKWWNQLAKSGRYGDPGPDESWKELPDRRSFRKSVQDLLLRSALSEPELVKDFLHHASESELSDEVFTGVLSYSVILSKACPIELVDFTLKILTEELPLEKHDKEEAAERADQILRAKIREKPESARTKKEKAVLTSWLPGFNRNRYDLFDWRQLAIADNHQTYSPPSPLREPFHTLFLYAPHEALRLIRKLCNHAMTAWRQLHSLSESTNGTPLPLRIEFPWGAQEFWGSSNVYIWFRSMGSPQAIGSGFMALEDWCFAELERGVEVDKLIETIVEENECIAILGVAAALAMHTEVVSDVSFALVISQRLLMADEFRFTQDFQSVANLMGFMGKGARPHIDAIQRANARSVRKKHLSWQIPNFMFSSSSFRERVQQAIRNLPSMLQFEYVEQSVSPPAQNQLLLKAADYAELIEEENYQAYRSSVDSEKIDVIHISPKASEAENVARREEAVKYLRENALQAWASNTFENGVIGSSFKLEEAIAVAKAIDDDIFVIEAASSSDQTRGSALRGSLAATAAVTLAFREEASKEDLEWARDVLWKAIEFPIDGDLSTVSTAVVPWHYAIYVARGLAADYSYDTAKVGTPIALLSLITHPLEMVSAAGLKETLKLWAKAPRLAWSAMYLALSMCKVTRVENRKLHPTMLHEFEVMRSKLDEAISVHDNDDWSSLPFPSPSWIKLDPDMDNTGISRKIVSDEHTGEDVHWGTPDEFWYSSLAAKYLVLFPYEELLKSEVRSELLNFLMAALDWTLKKISPPWENSQDRDRSDPEIHEWIHGLGRALGTVLGELPLVDARKLFLSPILELNDDKCWKLLEPLTDWLTRRHLYDATALSGSVLALLNDCIERFLKASEFDEKSYRRGTLHGFEQPALLKTLLFVSIEHAGLAARFVNGDWSEIRAITPLVDRLIREAGWSATVMTEFLTLCERAKEHYPAEQFASQVLTILTGKRHRFVGWGETSINARIAGLVQYFSNANAPMKVGLAQQFLQILDILVDMGDRRSAALQLSEAFREIRVV